MSHVISLKVTKFQQPLVITLGVADENRGGGGPQKIGLKAICFSLGSVCSSGKYDHDLSSY